jgi:DNA cross-link repair 1C protein
VYKSLVSKKVDDKFGTQTHASREAPYLVGHTSANNQKDGCLTLDENVRIHSCEKGTPCSFMRRKDIVWIKPIVAHLKAGLDVVEVGLGGGGGDLAKEADLQGLTDDDVKHLIEA